MRKLNFSLFHKLIVANILYALPAAALIYLMVDAKNENIDFARLELQGDVYQRPLEDLLQKVSNLRIGMISNHKADSADITAIDGAFEKLAKVQAKIGESLQFTDEGLKKRKRDSLKPSLVIGRWNDLKAKLNGDATDETIDAVGAVVGDLRGMITHTGDTSNLILDPDLDSYYLMDVTLCTLPQVQDRLQDLIRNFGNVISKGGKLTQKNRIDLAVYAALFKQSDLDRATGDEQTVLNEDPNFNGESPTLKTNLDPSIKEFSARMEKLIAMLTKLSDSSESSFSREEFLATAGDAVTQSFTTWKVGADELDILLKKRVSNMSMSKYKALGYALVALAGAFMILFLVAFSFSRNMQAILGALKGTLHETHEASHHLVRLSGNLSKSTTDQASALQETAAALEEINSMVQSTAQATDDAKRATESTLSTVETSGTAMSSLSGAMSGIAESNERILNLMSQNSEKMNQITGIISSIGDKTKVINDIVFQTKLLSFNASVEAARAGEHGKGFAVVAEEVGKLASMSGDASKEITDLLGSSVTQVTKLSDDTKSEVEVVLRESRNRLSSGEQVAHECHESLQAILEEFNQVKNNVLSITQAAEEQAKGIREITTAVNRLDSLTGENASMSRETAEQSSVMKDQAERIRNIVSTIEAEVLGRNDDGHIKHAV